MKKALLQCLCNYIEEGYGHVRGALVYVSVGFGMGTMLLGIMMLLRAVLIKRSYVF